MVIFQTPNPPLIIAIIGFIVKEISSGLLQRIGATIFYLAIIIWAYEEIKNGVNWFRKGLGIVVLAGVAYSLLEVLERG